MSTIGLIFSWVFGVLIAIFGLSALLSNSVASGVLLIASSLFLIPPARSFVFKQTGKTLPAFVRVFAALALVFVAFSGTETGNVETNGTTADIQLKEESAPQAASHLASIETTPSVESASPVESQSELGSETKKDSIVAEAQTKVVDSDELLGEWFNQYESLVFIVETLSNGISESGALNKREISKDCEIAIQQDLRQEEPSDLLARMGFKVHVYLPARGNEAYVRFTPHPNCVAAFYGDRSGPSLCDELKGRRPAGVVFDDKRIPISYTTAGVRWSIDARGFSEDNRVVSLNATNRGESQQTFAYVCASN
jgi:hypothetical protein